MTSLMVPRHEEKQTFLVPLDHLCDEAWDAAGHDTLIGVASVGYLMLVALFAPLATPVALPVAAFMHRTLKRYLYASDGLGLEP